MITIVGAGPAGLALAYYLKRYDLPFQILEKDEVAASWSRYYDHLRLHTRKSNVALPGLSMPITANTFPSRDQFAAYLKAYAEHFDFPIKTATKVLSAEYKEAWYLATNKCDIKTKHLVLATGIYANPINAEISGLEHYRGQLLTAKEYANPEPFKGKRVLVVGAGNTGVGIALGLSDAGVKTGLVVRDGIQLVARQKTAMGTRLKASLIRHLPRSVTNRWLRFVRKDFSNLGLPQPSKEPRDVIPVLGFELVQAVQEERIEVHGGIARLNAAGALFEDGVRAAYDVIILATGYRFDTSAIVKQDLKETKNLYTLGSHYPSEEPFLMRNKKEAAKLARVLKKVYAEQADS